MDVVTPKLDYLVQYGVKKVLVPESGYEWAIEFDNGAIVYNEDETLDAPTDLEGTSLLTVMYSQEETRMHFGISSAGSITKEQTITLNPLHYAILDPRFAMGEPHHPQQGAVQDEADLQTIRDEFAERAVEAPDPPAEGEDEPDEAQEPPTPDEAENGSQGRTLDLS